MELALLNRQALVLGASQGINRMTAIALAAKGARVTALARFPKNLLATLAKRKPSQKKGQPRKEIVQLWQNQVPAGRFAKSEEVAAACAFLASPQAGNCNGTSITVDGVRTPTF